MTHKVALRAAAAFLCLWSLGARSAWGQMIGIPPPEWQYIGSLGDKYHAIPLYSYTASYYFGPTNGVVTTSSNGIVIIYWLAPNVQTMGLWKVASIPAGLSYIRQFRFIQGKLYAASAGTDVLVSVDSGKTWSFSGLGLIDANDIYADGNGTIRALHDPMKVFARLDTMHCIAQGDANIFVSADGGLNWVSSGVPMVDSFSKGAFADQCKNVFVCPNSWGTAFRSTDFGQTWESILTASGTGPEYINGASMVVYLTDTLGMFRSTDDGLTWRSVITVDSGPCQPMFAFGPMGEHIIISCVVHIPGVGDYDVQLLSTTGGLDDLHGAPSMTDSNGAPLEQQDTMNVPLEMASTCQPFLIPITVESDVDSMTVRITLSDSLDDFALAASDSTIALRIHHEDTVWMQYDPHHSVSNVVLTFENHWNCSDWTETRMVHVDAIPSARIAPPPVFTASCIADTESAIVLADSCEVLCIDSVAIPSDISQDFRVATPLPDTAAIGSNDSLRFAFTATGMAGTMQDSIVIYGHYLGMDSLLNDYFYFPHASGIDTDFSFFYDRLPITLHALGSGTILSTRDSELNVGTRYLCDERDTFAVIKNPGCDTACIDTVTLSGTGFAIARGNGKVCLAPGVSDTVWLALAVDTIGHPFTNDAMLAIMSDANTPLPPLALLRKIQYPAAWELSLSSPMQATAGTQVTYKLLQSGPLPASVTSLDFTITYHDDLLGFVDNGDPAVTYSRTPDGLGHLHFHFAPVPADSILDSVIFTAFVSRDTQTALTLEDIVLGNSQNIASDCLASITSAQSSFTLLPQCGTPELTQYLRMGTIAIDKIEPNPAVSDVTIMVYSAVSNSVPGEVSIVDAMGRTVVDKSVGIRSGENRLLENLEQLPSGFYTARISTSQGEVERAFVKE